MRFFRLPAHIDDGPQWWQWGDGQEITVLIPGEALLSETLVLPAGLRRRRDIRQWLQASADACLWRPDKESLLRLVCEGERCFYWAAERQLWKYWQKLAEKLAPGARWMPDWMLLPEPDDTRPFALKADDTILFRHERGSGGALPMELQHLLEPLQPRWLTLPGKGQAYAISRTFLRSHIVCQGRRWPTSASSLLQRVSQYLLIVCAAFITVQSAQALWLHLTRQPPVEVVVHPASAEGRFQRSLRLLDDIQEKGPVRLNTLSLNGGTLRLNMTSLLTCNTWEDKLKSSNLSVGYKNNGSGCELTIQGKFP